MIQVGLGFLAFPFLVLMFPRGEVRSPHDRHNVIHSIVPRVEFYRRRIAGPLRPVRTHASWRGVSIAPGARGANRGHSRRPVRRRTPPTAGPEAPTANQPRDLLEIIEDRYDKGPLIITSHVPVEGWQILIGVFPLSLTPFSTASSQRLSHRVRGGEPAQATFLALKAMRAQGPAGRPSARQGGG